MKLIPSAPSPESLEARAYGRRDQPLALVRKPSTPKILITVN